MRWPANPKNWMVTALTAKWGVDQSTRNGVSANLGRETIQFVKQPDGRLTAPVNCTMTLSKSGTYSLQQRHGNKSVSIRSGGSRTWSILEPVVERGLQFEKFGADSYDWKGRYLTFTYSGSPQRRASVSDSTGRSVG